MSSSGSRTGVAGIEKRIKDLEEPREGDRPGDGGCGSEESGGAAVAEGPGAGGAGAVVCNPGCAAPGCDHIGGAEQRADGRYQPAGGVFPGAEGQQQDERTAADDDRLRRCQPG